MSRRGGISPEERRHWEDQLAAEGMPAEPKEDKGAKAAREAAGADIEAERKRGLAIRQAIQRYWVSRGNVPFGHHLQAAQEIAAAAGSAAQLEDIDEAYMKEVGDEVAAAELQLAKHAERLGGEPNILPARMTNTLLNEAKRKFPEIDPEALAVIAQKFTDRHFGG